MIFFSLPVLPNNRLSPKDNFRSTHNLSPGVNQFPHCHSVETETHIHFYPQSAESFDLLGFSRQQSDGFTMHRHFFIILHGKKNRSKNSRLSPESCFLPLHPFLQYFTPFQNAYHTYTHWQNFRSFRFPSKYIFNPFGYCRDFFSGEKHFHNFFCILFSPEPVPDITVMTAEFLHLG